MHLSLFATLIEDVYYAFGCWELILVAFQITTPGRIIYGSGCLWKTFVVTEITIERRIYTPLAFKGLKVFFPRFILHFAFHTRSSKNWFKSDKYWILYFHFQKQLQFQYFILISLSKNSSIWKIRISSWVRFSRNEMIYLFSDSHWD